MAESDFQRAVLTYAIEALGRFFEKRADVYVSGNLFIYYKKGDPESAVAPDVFVVFGVPKAKRTSYLLWQEGKAPGFVMEITSEATPAKDQGAKRGLYAYLGVREYFQFDPTGDYLRPRLQGLKLAGQNYEMLPTQELPGGLSVHSDVLGLDVRLVNGEMRFYDPATGAALRSLSEAEAEIERLRAELERLK